MTKVTSHVEQLDASEKDANLNLTKRYSFGSVRRQQGIVYRAKGGIVIGVRRPGVGPSGYEFDRFDEDLIDIWIDNDGTIEHLERKVVWAAPGDQFESDGGLDHPA
jgi:hypothetical protein